MARFDRSRWTHSPAMGDWRFRLVSRICGRMMVWAGKRALRLGDRHEFDHIHASVIAGNSDGCDPATCPHHERSIR